ncbi:hypothetical protein [Microvirga lotononidis]|uniref:Uncharacterized protein n=1 Tax=Microvirga lotononidis TaxID=864069 RepID=I4YQ91_9HYPH|nr:hypothetical protein [Microvirga lotononidis]EIM26133.1 hypothetical protein MicloDRAFT_00068650 [Microvirga lotononidis]WQO26037.1 hypothetical protein U0023_15130 [Microvirga lotononidis]
MTRQVSEQNTRPGEQSAARPIPTFKAVALPALAAAVQAAKLQQNPPKISELPAILRKEAMLD